MQAVATRLVVYPAATGLAFSAATLVASLFALKTFSYEINDLGTNPQMLAAALPTAAAYGYGTSRGMLTGVRSLLTEDRYLSRAIPDWMRDQESFSREDADRFARELDVFLNRPEFLQVRWQWLWRMALGSALDKDALTRLPRDLFTAVTNAKREGSKQLRNSEMAENMLAFAVTEQVQDKIMKLDRVSVPLVLALWAAPLVIEGSSKRMNTR